MFVVWTEVYLIQILRKSEILLGRFLSFETQSNKPHNRQRQSEELAEANCCQDHVKDPLHIHRVPLPRQD